MPRRTPDPAGTGRPSSPWGDDVRILFARCRIGLRTAASLCGAGTDARAVLSRCRPKITYSTVFARARLAACRRYSRPSGLGCTPHRGDFHPDATPTLGLGRSILFNHRPSKATAKCSRPTVFRVATPTHRSLRPHYVPPQLSPWMGGRRQGWSVAVSRARKALPRAIPVGVLRPHPIDLPART